MDILFLNSPYDRLRLLREHMRITQKEFCRLLNISKFKLNRIEKAKQKIDIDKVNNLRKFGINPSFILNEDKMLLGDLTIDEVKNNITSFLKNESLK